MKNNPKIDYDLPSSRDNERDWRIMVEDHVVYVLALEEQLLPFMALAVQ